MSGIARTSEPDETWLLIDNASGGTRQLIQWLGVPREVLGGGGHTKLEEEAPSTRQRSP